ncbi:RRXRR domain-containing protein [Plectonema radiosum NIES-515]|uniref:RRXRR domain-containing protein n=1 Tax=Plectonema radiosum NIES-515 TaxID=2986073 RepID=A0ABT3B1W3_9CYAN|nr:RRXRR domain-containing protein [Plectonema radiosum]MCV3215343.1 RRXRR domain-containing protein [Plectonema radiosum NIES-515]
MSNYVFLIDSNKTPMNPIHPSHARKLLEANKAAVFRRYPFVLVMNRVVENIITYPITFTHVSTGDFVKVTLHKDRKNIPSGIYNCRVKTPIKEGCEVVINGFRVGFSTMKDVFKIHRNDGYSYA